MTQQVVERPRVPDRDREPIAADGTPDELVDALAAEVLALRVRKEIFQGVLDPESDEDPISPGM